MALNFHRRATARGRTSEASSEYGAKVLQDQHEILKEEKKGKYFKRKPVCLESLGA
jgi:hypothetical protein